MGFRFGLGFAPDLELALFAAGVILVFGLVINYLYLPISYKGNAT